MNWPSHTSFGWRRYPWYRTHILALFAFLPVPWVILVLAGEGRGLARLAYMWLAVWVGNGYWFLLRNVHKLEVRDDQLDWATPLQTGSIPIVDIQSVRPCPGPFGGHVIETHQVRLWILFSTLGFDRFVVALHAVQPAIQVEIGAIVGEHGPKRMLRWSGFYRVE